MKKYVEDLNFSGEEYVGEWTPWSPQDIRRKKCVLEAARLMVDSAFTAPFAGGVPSLEAHIVYGQEELEAVARKVEEIAHTQESWKEPFLYEAVMVRDSDVIIFLGNTRCHETPLDAGCGMCGGTLDCGYFYEKKTTKHGLVDITDRSSDKMKVLDNTRKIYQTSRIIRGFDYRKWIPKPQKTDGPKTEGEGE